MTITGAKLSLWLGIAGGVLSVGGFLWHQAGEVRHNHDRLDWAVAHEAWTEIQLANVSKGQPIDWQHRPQP